MRILYMKTELTINNQVRAWYRRRRFLVLVQTTRRVTKIDKDIDISVAFVSDRVIQQANKQYRNKNRPTNVLSFCFQENGALQGEVLLCPAVIKQESQDQKIRYTEHLDHLFVHGVLHVLGFDHQTKEQERLMEGVEDAILT